MLFLYLFLVLFLLVPIEPRNVGIFNGTDANIADFPWMVGLYNEDSTMWCGGSLISPNWVLTAAHCTSFDKITRIRAGFDQLNDTVGVYVNVTESIPHPNFAVVVGTDVNDIALLHLETPISGDNIEPIRLPELNAPVPEGSFVNVTGWGYINDQDQLPDHLQVATLPVASTADCKKAFEEINLPVFVQLQFCAGTVGDNTGTCGGDAGGPVVFNRTVIGIVSWWGKYLCTSGLPTVVTNVASYRDWIHEVTGI